MMMIMVLLTHRRSNCLVIRGQIFFREKKGVLERKRAREDDYDMIRRNEILTRSLPGLRLQIRRLPPQTPPPYTALAKSKPTEWNVDTVHCRSGGINWNWEKSGLPRPRLGIAISVAIFSTVYYVYHGNTEITKIVDSQEILYDIKGVCIKFSRPSEIWL